MELAERLAHWKAARTQTAGELDLPDPCPWAERAVEDRLSQLLDDSTDRIAAHRARPAQVALFIAVNVSVGLVHTSSVHGFLRLSKEST